MEASGRKKMIEIKIGRYEYTFTENDIFLDNGSTVQCLTVNDDSGSTWHKFPVRITKKAMKEILDKCEMVDKKYNSFGNLEFKIKLK